MSNAYVGEIKLVGFNFAPRGFALCAGSTLAIQQNAALFSLLGTTYGGNGTTTFQLPNLQGRLPVGMGNGAGLSPYVIGEVGGSQTANILIANMPAHNHVLTGNVAVATTVGVTNVSATKLGPNGHILAPGTAATTPAAAVSSYSDQAANGTLGGVASAVTSTLATAITGSGTPISTLPPFLAINYVIATTGIFPSRN